MRVAFSAQTRDGERIIDLQFNELPIEYYLSGSDRYAIARIECLTP